MRLSRSRKAVLLGTALLTVGMAGRAAAETAPPPSSHPAKAGAQRSGPRDAGPALSGIAGRPRAELSMTHLGGPATPAAGPGTPGLDPPGQKIVGSPGPAPGSTLAGPGTGPAHSHVTTGTNGVALTFDDGPDPIQTPRLLKLLAQQQAHATFCLVGENVQRHPELVRAIVAGGNTLCNHTWNHSLTLGRRSPAAIRSDLSRTNAAIRRAVPGASIRYFRAPGGNFTSRLVSGARQLGMTSIYWQVDPRDWEHLPGESHAAHRARIIRNVESHTRRGSIVLSHDFNQPDTIAAYRILLPWLHRRFALIALP